jgi:hypothetical protein
MSQPRRPQAFLRAARGAASSMETGLALFAIVACVAVVGSLSPALSEAIYGSWPFAALLVALVANILACAIARRPGLDRARAASGKARLRALCVFAIHLSVLAVAAAALWAGLEFTTERIDVAEGEGFQVEGRSLRLDSIGIERYADGSVSDWVSRLNGPSGQKATVRVNHPLRVGGTKVLQTGYGRRYSLLVALPEEGIARKVEIEEKALLPLAKDGSIGIVLKRPETGEGGRAVELALVSGSKALLEAAVSEGVPFALGDTGIEITVTGSRAYGSFILRRAPGIAFLWVGFALLAISACGLLIDPATPRDKGGKTT